MKKINVLSRQTAQLIAAGEVVERPSSVLKELLENSIDSGATRITAEIKNGGVKCIKVLDNGDGIYREDVKNAFLRHATSKLRGASDLERISSLGFRGEALASICAVSRLEVITKSKAELIGTRYCICGGEPGELEDAGCPDGTSISVRDLFYNTPARMKFLKKDVAEANACAAVVDKLALSHPEISFKLIKDGKVVLSSCGDGKISSAVYSVYGKDFFDGMICVEYQLKNIKISGFVSKPLESKPTRTMQNFFVNGRYVKSMVGSNALQEAFKNSIMIGKFPYCVLYINVLPELVDVNVHPAKTEIKFVNEKAVFEAIYYGVKSALMSTKPNFTTNSEQSLCNSRLNDRGNPILKANATFECSSLKDIHSSSDLNAINYQPEQKSFLNFNFQSERMQNLPKSQEKMASILPNSHRENTEPYFQKDFICKEEPLNFQSYTSLSPKIIGEIFDCYILMECGNDIVLVDKHAAHERIIFEKLKSGGEKNESQGLIEPLVITLEKKEYGALLENILILSKAGYIIEDFGSGTIAVRGIPMYINLQEAGDSLCEIAEYIIDNKKNIDTKKLEWLYENIACRAAVKGGKGSSLQEIKSLVNQLVCNPDIKYCPHGRPVFVSITKKFIEKQFGRA